MNSAPSLSLLSLKISRFAHFSPTPIKEVLNKKACLPSRQEGAG